MANYHFETKIISRGKGGSVTGAVSYVIGQEIALYELMNDPNQFPRRQLVGQRADELPRRAGIPAYLRPLDLIAREYR